MREPRDTHWILSFLGQIVGAIVWAAGILLLLIFGMMAYAAWNEFPPCTEEMVKAGSDCLRKHH